MSHKNTSIYCPENYYEKIAVDFAKWISGNGYIMDDEGTWWNPKVNGIVAESTDELLQIFKTK